MKLDFIKNVDVLDQKNLEQIVGGAKIPTPTQGVKVTEMSWIEYAYYLLAQSIIQTF